MEIEEVKIEVYNKREESIATMFVRKVSDNVFRMVDNDIFDCSLTLGTEFETRINSEGYHEIIRITKRSDFVTRRFLLTPKFKQSEYRLLGDEIVKHGGFWQVDFGSIVTINIPKDTQLNIDEIFKILDIRLAEIKSEKIE